MNKRRKYDVKEIFSSDSEASSDIESQLLIMATKRKRKVNRELNLPVPDLSESSDTDSILEKIDKVSESTKNTLKKAENSTALMCTRKVNQELDLPLPALSESSDTDTCLEKFDKASESTKNTQNKAEKSTVNRKLNSPLLALSESSDTDTTTEKLDNDNESPKTTQNKVEKLTAYVSEHVDVEVSVSEVEEVKKYESESSSSSSSSGSSYNFKFNDGYDENFVGDEADRKRLSNLTEKERETEIFKRIEQREFMQSRWEIQKKLKSFRKSEKAKRKEKRRKNTKPPIQSEQTTTSNELPKNMSSNEQISGATTNEYVDHKERSKERKRNVELSRTDEKRSNAMAILKEQREEKAKREEELEVQRQAEKQNLKRFTGDKPIVKLKTSDVYSDVSDSSDWDEDEKPIPKHTAPAYSNNKCCSGTEPAKALAETQPRFIISRKELNKIRLSRFKLEKFISLPIFERTVLNCFVRINVGNNSQSNSVYRVAEIVGVVELPKIYNFGKVRTNKYLRVKHGNQERNFRLQYISNQEFTETEVLKWHNSCFEDNVEIPSVNLIEKKLADIQAALDYQFNDENVDQIVEEKKQFRDRPTNYAMEKARLITKRDAAMLHGDYELAQKLSQQIKELESRASELDQRRSYSINAISYINERNRKCNIENAEKNILTGARVNKALQKTDVYTRRLTQPRMVCKQQTIQKKELVNNEKHKLEHHNIKTKSKNNDQNSNLYSLHDFDIDLDIKLPVNMQNNLPKPMPKIAVPAAPTKRSLKLEDYKKNRGLI